jgi:hypothetical protein
MAAYGVDVLDPAVSTRRVGVLVDRLPPYARNTGEQWSTEAELLAVLVDHVANLTWVTLRAHGAKNVARPRPVPRPGSRAQSARNSAPPPAGSRNGTGNEGPRKAGSWLDAARQLATIPGVKMSGDG